MDPQVAQQLQHGLVGELEGDRVLWPEGAVVIEHGQAFLNGHPIGRAALADPLHEAQQGLLEAALPPGGKGSGPPRSS